MSALLYYEFIYSTYRNNNIISQTTYNLLDSFTDANQTVWPAITADEYSYYTAEQARERATALEGSLSKCTNYASAGDVWFENAFTATPDEISVSGGVHRLYVNIDSQQDFYAENTPDWLNITIDGRNGCWLDISQNLSENDRTATLIFKQEKPLCSGGILEVGVTQTGSVFEVLGYIDPETGEDTAIDFGDETLIITLITI